MIDKDTLKDFHTNLKRILNSTNLEVALYSECDDPVILVAVFKRNDVPYEGVADEVILELTKITLDIIEEAAKEINLQFIGVEHFIGHPTIKRIHANSKRIKLTVELEKGLALRFVELTEEKKSG